MSIISVGICDLHVHTKCWLFADFRPLSMRNEASWVCSAVSALLAWRVLRYCLCPWELPVIMTVVPWRRLAVVHGRSFLTRAVPHTDMWSASSRPVTKLWWENYSIWKLQQWCVPKSYIIYTLTSFLGVFAKFRKATISFVCPCVRPSAWNNWSVTGRIFMKFDIWVFFENMLRNASYI